MTTQENKQEVELRSPIETQYPHLSGIVPNLSGNPSMTTTEGDLDLTSSHSSDISTSEEEKEQDTEKIIDQDININRTDEEVEISNNNVDAESNSEHQTNEDTLNQSEKQPENEDKTLKKEQSTTTIGITTNTLSSKENAQLTAPKTQISTENMKSVVKNTPNIINSNIINNHIGSRVVDESIENLLNNLETNQKEQIMSEEMKNISIEQFNKLTIPKKYLIRIGGFKHTKEEEIYNTLLPIFPTPPSNNNNGDDDDDENNATKNESETSESAKAEMKIIIEGNINELISVVLPNKEIFEKALTLNTTKSTVRDGVTITVQPLSIQSRLLFIAFLHPDLKNSSVHIIPPHTPTSTSTSTSATTTTTTTTNNDNTNINSTPSAATSNNDHNDGDGNNECIDNKNDNNVDVNNNDKNNDNKNDDDDKKKKNNGEEKREEAETSETKLQYNEIYEEVFKRCESIGETNRHFVVINPTTGDSLGYAFVEFLKKDDAKAAVASLSTDPNLRVEFADCEDVPSMFSKTLLVEQIPTSLTNNTSLRKIFTKFGHVKEAILSLSPINSPKRFAYIEFNNVTDANRARSSMHLISLLSSPLKVSFANPSKSLKDKIRELSKFIPRTSMITPPPLPHHHLSGAPRTSYSPSAASAMLMPKPQLMNLKPRSPLPPTFPLPMNYPILPRSQPNHPFPPKSISVTPKGSVVTPLSHPPHSTNAVHSLPASGNIHKPISPSTIKPHIPITPKPTVTPPNHSGGSTYFPPQTSSYSQMPNPSLQPQYQTSSSTSSYPSPYPSYPPYSPSLPHSLSPSLTPQPQPQYAPSLQPQPQPQSQYPNYQPQQQHHLQDQQYQLQLQQQQQQYQQQYQQYQQYQQQQQYQQYQQQQQYQPQPQLTTQPQIQYQSPSSQLSSSAYQYPTSTTTTTINATLTTPTTQYPTYQYSAATQLPQTSNFYSQVGTNNNYQSYASQGSQIDHTFDPSYSYSASSSSYYSPAQVAAVQSSYPYPSTSVPSGKRYPSDELVVDPNINRKFRKF